MFPENVAGRCFKTLKTKVEKELRSGTVYQIQCPSCKACYVGQTSRHLLTRFKEHTRPSAPVRKHFDDCTSILSFECMNLLKTSARGEAHLLTLEAIFIEEMKPTINRKDEYRSRALTIRVFWYDVVRCSWTQTISAFACIPLDWF